jgi:hypothetical protein
VSDFNEIVRELQAAVATVVSDRKIDGDELRDVLAFLSRVSQVVEQAFQEVLTLALELAYLDIGSTDQARLLQLRKELELLTARSHYSQSLEICSRLKHLKQQFENHIEPLLGGMSRRAEWHELFWLIEDREGRLIQIVQRSASVLEHELDSAINGRPSHVTQTARLLVGEVKPLLGDLRELTSKILGLSGRDGFLELTRDRRALQREVNLVIEGNVSMSRDTYNVRNAGAVGPNSRSVNATINDNSGMALQQLNMNQLADELNTLRESMRSEAQTTEQFNAVAAISSATDAAKSGETSTVFEKLKSAGQWALDVSTKVGTTLAAEAIKRSMGWN